MYTLTQVERHRALTAKFPKAWGDTGWSPARWIHWCLAHSTFFADKWRNVFQFSSIPTEYRHGPYKRRLKNCFKGWSLVRPSMRLPHRQHCMSMNALEQAKLMQRYQITAAQADALARISFATVSSGLLGRSRKHSVVSSPNSTVSSAIAADTFSYPR